MPYTQRGLPFSGRTPMSRQNSYKAAVAEGATRGEKKQRVLAYLRTVRAATDQGIAEGVRLPLSSICSLRNHLVSEGLVRQVGRVMGRFGHPVTLWSCLDQWPAAVAAFNADAPTEAASTLSPNNEAIGEAICGL